jgi:hypothetical protein
VTPPPSQRHQLAAAALVQQLARAAPRNGWSRKSLRFRSGQMAGCRTSRSSGPRRRQPRVRIRVDRRCSGWSARS